MVRLSWTEGGGLPVYSRGNTTSVNFGAVSLVSAKKNNVSSTVLPASHASCWPHSDKAVIIASTLGLGRRLRSQMLGEGLQIVSKFEKRKYTN